jgi:peptidoglycan/LPS O-acetylase OafA/YrhL
VPFGAWTDPVVLLFGVGIVLSIIRPAITVPEGISGHLVTLACLGTVVTVILLWLAPTYPPSLTAHVLAWLACATTILVAASARIKRSSFNQFLALLGNASYSTYLCHNIVINPVYKLVGGKLGPALSIPVMVIGANIVGIMLYRFFETPLNKVLRSLTSAKHKMAPQVVQTV